MTIAVDNRTAVPIRTGPDYVGEESRSTAVSWAAIIAGAVAAMATTMILLILGTGVGLSMVSPWYGQGASATTVGVSAVVTLVVIQWIASGAGGFLAGRLRTKWTGLHSHEVFFRDTAHGFLAWAAASVLGALLFASATASGVGGLAHGATDVTAAGAAGAAQAGVQKSGGSNANDPSAYFVDTMFRSTNPNDGEKTDPRPETTRILTKSMQNGQIALAPADKAYLAQTVQARTGLAQPEAEQRVDAVVAQMNDAQMKARQAADIARKRTAQLSIVIALSMLIGAFVASAAAALGGSIRDEY
jgi:hypothetical protein